MSRALTVREPKFENDTWRAYPSATTTVAELQRAVDAGFGVYVNTWDEEGIAIVPAPWSAADPNWTPPTVDELARVMFGREKKPTLVTESGFYKTLDEDTIPVG